MKEGEINYLRAIGKEGRVHAAGKPYSDSDCGRYLVAMGQIMELLPPPPAKILDLGCGTGWTSLMLAKRGYTVVGCDIAADMIECANESRQNEPPGTLNLTYCIYDYENLPFESSFDVVLFFDALHHAENETAALAASWRALRPGGICVTSEPGEGHSHTPASVQAVERLNVNEKDMPPCLIRRMGHELGFDCEVYPQMQEWVSMVAPRQTRHTGSLRHKIAGIIHRMPLGPEALLFLQMVRLKHKNGIVVLTKPANDKG